ncbi:hypothetical protein DFH29DRAFT_965657, partial [Suillus ampliporus]
MVPTVPFASHVPVLLAHLSLGTTAQKRASNLEYDATGGDAAIHEPHEARMQKRTYRVADRSLSFTHTGFVSLEFKSMSYVK